MRTIFAVCFVLLAIAAALGMVVAGALAYPAMASIVAGAFVLTALRLIKRLVLPEQTDDDWSEIEGEDAHQEGDHHEWESVGVHGVGVHEYPQEAKPESDFLLGEACQGEDGACGDIGNQCGIDDDCHAENEVEEAEEAEEDTPWQLVFGIWSMVTLLMLLPSGFLYGVGWLLR